MEFAYLYEQFEEHLRDLLSDIQGDGSPSYAHATLATMKYMRERFPQDEALEKGTRFMMAIHYLSSNLNRFDKGDYAVCGSQDVGGLASRHLLKATHHWFMQPEVSRPHPRELMKLADTFLEPAAHA